MRIPTDVARRYRAGRRAMNAHARRPRRIRGRSDALVELTLAELADQIAERNLHRTHLRASPVEGACVGKMAGLVEPP